MKQVNQPIEPMKCHTVLTEHVIPERKNRIKTNERIAWFQSDYGHFDKIQFARVLHAKSNTVWIERHLPEPPKSKLKKWFLGVLFQKRKAHG